MYNEQIYAESKNKSKVKIFIDFLRSTLDFRNALLFGSLNEITLIEQFFGRDKFEGVPQENKKFAQKFNPYSTSIWDPSFKEISNNFNLEEAIWANLKIPLALIYDFIKMYASNQLINIFTEAISAEINIMFSGSTLTPVIFLYINVALLLLFVINYIILYNSDMYYDGFISKGVIRKLKEFKIMFYEFMLMLNIFKILPKLGGITKKIGGLGGLAVSLSLVFVELQRYLRVKGFYNYLINLRYDVYVVSKEDESNRRKLSWDSEKYLFYVGRNFFASRRWVDRINGKLVFSFIDLFVNRQKEKIIGFPFVDDDSFEYQATSDKFYLKFEKKNIKGGGEKNGINLIKITTLFYSCLYDFFIKYPLQGLKFYLFFTGKMLVSITKNVIGYFIPQFIKNLFYGKPEIKELKENNLAVIDISDNNTLLEIVEKYKIKDVKDEDNHVNIDKLYDEMLNNDNNEDFLKVHKIHQKAHLGDLKNKNDWRVLSAYKKILYARKLDNKR
jgi:hypothetical protein